MVGSAAIKQGRSANRKHTYFFFWASRQLTLKKGAPGDQVWDLLCMQLASYLEGGPLVKKMPLHVNYKSPNDMMIWWDFLLHRFLDSLFEMFQRFSMSVSHLTYSEAISQSDFILSQFALFHL